MRGRRTTTRADRCERSHGQGIEMKKADPDYFDEGEA
jgi:hypothetical protein